MDKISYNTAGYRVTPTIAPSVPMQLRPTYANAGMSGGMNMNAAGSIAGAIGSQFEMSPSQKAVSQMGPWGAIIGAASAVGTSIGGAIGGDVGGAISGAFDPAAMLTDKNLSTGKKLIGAAIPVLGGIWSSRAKKAAEQKAKEQAQRDMDAQVVSGDAAQRTAAMRAENPNIQPQVMKSGGWIKSAITPSHKGFCTPLSKPTCTGRRRALALRFKKGGDLHKDSKAYGGELYSYASGGGLSREENYGSSKKPYPSVKSSDFAGGGRSYPIPTKADAVDALKLAGLHGRSDVKSKVYAKYPSLKKAYGGELDTPTLKEYGGLTHEQSPTGGTPVDANGNITSKANASALVEGKEVAWNRGKNDTYIFSNRLGFATPAKTIMNQYKDRLGKDLNGNDQVSRNTMNRKLESLESQQEAVKSVLGLNEGMVKANGGNVDNPDTPPTSAYKFKDPGNESYFNSFKEEWESDTSGKDRARMNAYKAKLDPLLRSKDSTNFDRLLASSPKSYSKKLEAADAAYKSGKYSAYLSPEEIKKTLGKDYDDYVGLMGTYGAESVGIKGKNETGNIPNLNYGFRTSEAIQPYKYVRSVMPAKYKQPTAKFEGNVSYDPSTKQYKYEYAQPIEYRVVNKGEFDTMACGGKIKKMADGGLLDNNLDIDMSNVPTKAKYNTLGLSKGEAYSPKLYNPSYLGDIVPIAGAAGISMLGNLYAINQLSKNKPKDIYLSRVNPRTISLGNARQSLRQSAGENLANLRTTAKNLGGQGYMNQVIAGTTGTQRELGKNLLQSYQTEALTNAQALSDADRANMAAAAQEASINAQRKDVYNSQKAALTSNLFTIPQQAMVDYLKNKGIRDAAQASGNYDIVTDPTNRFRLKFKARKQ